MGGYTFGKKRPIEGMLVKDYMPLEKCPRYKKSDILIDGIRVVFCKSCSYRVNKKCGYKSIRGETINV